MSWRFRTAWLALSVAVVSAAFASTWGDRGDKNDVPVPGAAGGAGGKGAAAAVNVPAKGTEKKKRALDQDLVTVLYRVGLQPENLTAAGISAQAAGEVVGGVKTWLAANTKVLDDVDDRFAAAADTKDTLIRAVRSGLATEDQLAQLDPACKDFDAVSAERQKDLDDVFKAGTSSLASDQATLLSRIHVNQAAWGLPLQYLVVDRAEADWVALRDALDNERVCAKEGEDADAGGQQLLSTVRSDSTVSGATTSLNTTLGDVTTAWEAAAAVQ